MTNDTDAGAPAAARIAGFWRRAVAALADWVLLAIIGFVIGTLFTDQLIALGPAARAVGLPVALLYFGLFNSALGGGATLGKRALGIRVVGRGGGGISVLRSLWRAAVYLVPFFVNGLDLSFLPFNDTGLTIAALVAAFLVFGILGASLYLYIFNFRTRQVMHDLAAGTYVVRAESAAPPVAVRINRAHLVVVSLWLLLFAVALPVGLRHGIAQLKNWFGPAVVTEMDATGKIQAAVNADPRVASSTVVVNTMTLMMTNQPTTTTSYLVVTATLHKAPDDPQAVDDALAARVLAVAPDALGQQELTVAARYGYNIGIWGSWNGRTTTYTPAEWRARLHLAQPAKSH